MLCWPVSRSTSPGRRKSQLRSKKRPRPLNRQTHMQTKTFVAGGINHMPAGLGVKGKAIVRSIDTISALILRYGLVLVVFWIGCLKFTAYESKGVFNHASHSPLLARAYHILDVRDFPHSPGLLASFWSRMLCCW